MPLNAVKKIATENVSEVANASLVSGGALFGIALADIAVYVTIGAGVLSVIGLSLGIYLKMLEIRSHKLKNPTNQS